MSAVMAAFVSSLVRGFSAWTEISRRPRWAMMGVLVLGICGGWATAEAAVLRTADKWRIVCMRDALSDGEVVFRLTPVDGEPLELKVPIKAGTYENDIARQIRDVLRAKLSKELYHVETDDGEAVLVKKRMGKPTFRLEFVSHSVNGLGIRVELD
jgi:hypothetical protein